MEQVEEKLVEWLRVIDSAPWSDEGVDCGLSCLLKAGVVTDGSELVGDNGSGLAETHPSQVSQVAGACQIC